MIEPLLRYESRGGYVEYIVGNIPIVISVPHGGYLRPAHVHIPISLYIYLSIIAP